RIKIKIKPGWDVDVVREVRNTFPNILLMADANSAYTLEHAEHLKQLDEFNLMMIEQPLAHDDIVDHAVLQAQIETPLCLDECIRNAHHAEQAIALAAGRILNIKLGRVGGFREARRIHDVPHGNAVILRDIVDARPGASTMSRRITAFPCGAEACLNPVSDARTISRFR